MDVCGRHLMALEYSSFASGECLHRAVGCCRGNSQTRVLCNTKVAGKAGARVGEGGEGPWLGSHSLTTAGILSKLRTWKEGGRVLSKLSGRRGS